MVTIDDITPAAVVECMKQQRLSLRRGIIRYSEFIAIDQVLENGSKVKLGTYRVADKESLGKYHPSFLERVPEILRSYILIDLELTGGFTYSPSINLLAEAEKEWRQQEEKMR